MQVSTPTGDRYVHGCLAPLVGAGFSAVLVVLPPGRLSQPVLGLWCELDDEGGE